MQPLLYEKRAKKGLFFATLRLYSWAAIALVFEFDRYLFYTLMPLDILVLIKQVPDTRGVNAPLMTAEGIVNRASLPTITNPDDLCALEQALRIKDQAPDTTVRLLTMGPPSAVEALKEGLFRGATSAALLTGRAFAAADTLATSYALSQCIQAQGQPSLIFCGQQSLDGDTAHVGAQVAELLGYAQVTQVVEVESVSESGIIACRHADVAEERVSAPFPCLLAVSGEAAPCRTRNIQQLLRFKHAAILSAQASSASPAAAYYAQRPYLTIEEWSEERLGIDPTRIGLKGSPTQVWQTLEVAFAPKENESFGTDEQEIARLLQKMRRKADISCPKNA